jgi:hypothetical protein
VFVALVVGGAARAQAPRSKTIGKESPPKAPSGEVAQPPSEVPYAGVTPGGGGAPPEQKPPPAGMSAITWPGFHVGPQGSEVFLQLTGSVTYTEKRKGRKLHVTIDKAVVPLRNNLRPIITGSFRRTPVERFRLRLVGKDQVRLEVQLRRKTTHAVALQTRGQATFLVVSFPPIGAKKE